MTQVNSRFAVSDLTQDGYTSGQLTGIKIEDSGIITASYSNGQTQAAGQVALVNFRNAQGLSPTGARLLGRDRGLGPAGARRARAKAPSASCARARWKSRTST